MNENQMEELNKNLELIKSQIEEVTGKVNMLKSTFKETAKSMEADANKIKSAFNKIDSAINKADSAFNYANDLVKKGDDIKTSSLITKYKNFMTKLFKKNKFEDIKLPDVTAKLGLNPIIELGKGWGASLKNILKPITDMFSNLWSIISGVFTSIFTKLWNGLSSFFGLVSGAFSWLINGAMQLPVIGPIIEWISGILSTVFANLQALFGAIAASPVLIMAVFALIIGAIVQLWQTNEEFRNKLIEAFNNIMDTLTSLWQNIIQPIFLSIIAICMNVYEFGIKPLWEAWVELVGIVISILADLWNGISPIFNKILEVIGPIFKDALHVLSIIVAGAFNGILAIITGCFKGAGFMIEGFFGILGSIKDVLSAIIDWITGVFTGVWESAWKKVKDIFSSIFESLGEPAKTALNAVIKFFNGAIRGLNKFKFDIPEWVLGIGGKTFSLNISEIPYLAQGGIASRATLGVFGEAGTEAIIPLKRNTQGIEMIANKLLENMPINNGNGTYMIQLVLEDGTVLAKKLIKNIKDYEVMTGKPAF